LDTLPLAEWGCLGPAWRWWVQRLQEIGHDSIIGGGHQGGGHEEERERREVK